MWTWVRDCVYYKSMHGKGEHDPETASSCLIYSSVILPQGLIFRN